MNTTIKWNVKEYGRIMQTQITYRCVIEEETEELVEKSLCHPPSGNRSTKQSVEIHRLARDLPSLIYSLYLSPPSSYSNKASRNCVLSSSLDPATSSMVHLPSLASSNAFQQHQNLTWSFERVWLVFGISTSQWYGNREIGVEEIHKLICRDIWVW